MTGSRIERVVDALDEWMEDRPGTGVIAHGHDAKLLEAVNLLWHLAQHGIAVSDDPDGLYKYLVEEALARG